MTDRPQVLYRMYDDADFLLYVGITLDPVARFAAHREDKPWWQQVSRIDLEHYDTRAEVEAAEAAAILDESPLYNRAGRPVYGPPRPPRRGPNPDHTRARPIRVPDEDWTKFERTAGFRQRAAVLLEFIRWYNREPGARLPKRPDPPAGE